MRSRRYPRLSALSPPPLAAAVRPVVATLSALLPAQSGEPELRPAFAVVVRAKPSGRGFCRNFCRLAAAALALAHALCRLAGAQEAGICRRADDGDRRLAAGAHASGKSRSAQQAYPDARRLLQEEARALRRRHAENL